MTREAGIWRFYTAFFFFVIFVVFVILFFFSAQGLCWRTFFYSSFYLFEGLDMAFPCTLICIVWHENGRDVYRTWHSRRLCGGVGYTVVAS
jgi:hypothetical protein